MGGSRPISILDAHFFTSRGLDGLNVGIIGLSALEGSRQVIFFDDLKKH